MQLALYFGPRKGIRDKLISSAVKTVTKGKYDHAEIIFSDGRTGTSSLDGGGVQIVYGKKHPPEHWHVVPLDPARFSENKAWEWYRKHRGDKFDVWAVFGFMWPYWRRDHPNRWFCSEAAAAALRIADPWRFDPNTLLAAVHV